MLISLSIKNYVLIDHLVIDFASGLTTITGETGSGKSIMLGALGLVLGERADVRALRNPERKCVIEGTFDITNLELAELFEAMDVDLEPQTLLRREINKNGKSRAFINDTPVTLSHLRELAMRLIDIHSQHQTLQVSSAEFQLNVIDSFAGSTAKFRQYQKVFAEHKNCLQKLKELEEANRQARQDLDYFQFQASELQSAALETIELSALEEELQTLENAGEIVSALGYSAEVLTGEPAGTIATLTEVRNTLNKISGFNSRFKNLADRIQSCLLELKDAAAELENGNLAGETDPQREQELRDKLNAIYHLQNKHGVRTVEELRELQNQFENKIQSSENLEEEIVQVTEQLGKLRNELFKTGEELAALRQEAAKPLTAEIQNILTGLNMAEAKLKIEFLPLEEPTAAGLYKVQLLFQANKGSASELLQKVASGGELSRVMLGIKAVLVKSGNLPTIIFDEIDTGVSGDTAQKMGAILEQMGRRMQVICITHLPQIAARGNSHLKVVKTSDEKTTHTSILPLSAEEKTEEIARMLSGARTTDAALANARELLSGKM